MLVSYNWLQTYFKEKLPEPEELADIITMGVFEIESIEKKGEGEKLDTVLDIKVLPDRSSYCLSHRYIAQEIGALLNYEYITPEIEEIDVEETKYVFDASIEEPTEGKDPIAYRYVTRVIEHVAIGPSPDWLKERLEVLGQRSINAIVDLTNYIMLETGQPLHVFDADKVEGNIVIRKAKDGEQVVTLDNKNITLDSSMIIIADDVAPLDIAGIKGGKKAELTTDTTRIMTSAACFHAPSIRRASQKSGVRTDASKRFENAVTPERAGLAESMLASYIKKLDPQAVVGQVIDIYPDPVGVKTLIVSKQSILERLGISISENEIAEILTRCGMAVEIRNSESSGEIEFLISVPPYRRDIEIAEDIADEVGRIYGYDKIEGVEPEPVPRQINKNFYYHALIKKTLAEQGFSEVFTYSLTDNGEMAIQNPLTVERAFMRDSISDMMSRKLLFNLRNADLLGLKEIKIFEIGKVFSGNNERYSLAIGIARNKNPKGHDAQAEIRGYFTQIFETIGFDSVPAIKFTEAKGDAQTQCDGLVGEINLDPIIEEVSEPTEDISMGRPADIRFASISAYPFSARDVAVFVPGEAEAAQSVLNSIQNALSADQRKLLVRTTLFDVFTKRKEGEPVKTSYAYRLVFQSNERTLTEEEIVGMMKSVTDALAAEGWEVR